MLALCESENTESMEVDSGTVLTSPERTRLGTYQSKVIKLYHMWWLMSEILVLMQLKQEDHHEFEIDLDNTVSSRSAWAMV